MPNSEALIIMNTNVSRDYFSAIDCLADFTPTLHYQRWICVQDAVESSQGLSRCTYIS